MANSKFLLCVLLCVFGILSVRAQVKSSIHITSADKTETISIILDRPVYFAGDTVLLVIQRDDSVKTAIIIPILPFGGAMLKLNGQSSYVAVVPQSIIPGSYPVRLRVIDTEGRQFQYETHCVVAVEEQRAIEQLTEYVSALPVTDSDSIQTPVTVDREQLKKLEVHFQRENIRVHMGPSFLE